MSLEQQTELKRLFVYDSETGWFTNRFSRGRAKEGARAGADTGHGYRRIAIEYVRHYEHHLAWLYIHAVYPYEIDHINGNPSDNRIANLRLCTRTQNNCNAQMETGESGLRGAYLDYRSLKWYSKIQFGGRVTYLGSFDTAEEAHEAFEAAATRLHGEFYRHDINQPQESQKWPL